jgi:hypothetical protein
MEWSWLAEDATDLEGTTSDPLGEGFAFTNFLYKLEACFYNVVG